MQGKGLAKAAEERRVIFRGLGIFDEADSGTYIHYVQAAVDEVYFFIGMIAGICLLEGEFFFAFPTKAGKAHCCYTSVYNAPKCVHALEIFPFVLFCRKVPNTAFRDVRNAPRAQHLHASLVDLEPGLVVGGYRVAKRNYLRV